MKKISQTSILDKAYGNPELVPWYAPNIPDELAELASKIKQGKVLDMGCGTGDYAIYLAKKGFKVTAIDISQKAIDYAKQSAQKQGVEVDFKVLNAIQISKLKDKFDLVFEWGVLHFIPFEDREQYVKSVAHLLSSKGFYASLSFSDESPEWGGGKIRKGVTGATIYYSSMNELKSLFHPYFKILVAKKRKTLFKNSGNEHIHNYLLMEKS